VVGDSGDPTQTSMVACIASLGSRALESFSPGSVEGGGSLPSCQETLLPEAMAVTGIAAYCGLQNAGLTYTTAGSAALLQALLPVGMALSGSLRWLGGGEARSG